MTSFSGIGTCAQSCTGLHTHVHTPHMHTRNAQHNFSLSSSLSLSHTHTPFIRSFHEPKTRHNKKENYRPTSLLNIGVKFFKALANIVEEYIKRVSKHNQIGFLPRMQG